jgi:hypothetical protein
VILTPKEALAGNENGLAQVLFAKDENYRKLTRESVDSPLGAGRSEAGPYMVYW